MSRTSSRLVLACLIRIGKWLLLRVPLPPPQASWVAARLGLPSRDCLQEVRRSAAFRRRPVHVRPQLHIACTAWPLPHEATMRSTSTVLSVTSSSSASNAPVQARWANPQRAGQAPPNPPAVACNRLLGGPLTSSAALTPRLQRLRRSRLRERSGEE